MVVIIYMFGVYIWHQNVCQNNNISIGLHNHYTVTLGQVKGTQYMNIKIK